MLWANDLFVLLPSTEKIYGNMLCNFFSFVDALSSKLRDI